MNNKNFRNYNWKEKQGDCDCLLNWNEICKHIRKYGFSKEEIEEERKRLQKLQTLQHSPEKLQHTLENLQ